MKEHHNGTHPQTDRQTYTLTDTTRARIQLTGWLQWLKPLLTGICKAVCLSVGKQLNVEVTVSCYPATTQTTG